MEIPVLIEVLPDGRGYEARAGEPFAVTARAATEQEALAQLERAVRDRVRGRARLRTLRLPTDQAVVPTEFLPDDEFTRGWMAETAEYRRRMNEEPDPWETTPEGRAALGGPDPAAGPGGG